MCAELSDIRAGAEFVVPERYSECAGTEWKLLKVYYDEASGKDLGAYAPVDYAAAISEEDLEELTLLELESSYDVEVAELDHIKAWVEASKITAVVVQNTEDLRRSSRLRNT